MSLYAGSASVLTFRIAANLYPHPQPAGAGQPDCISTSPSLFLTSIVWCMVCFITTSALTSRYANLTLSCPSSAKVHINFQRPSLTLRPKPSRLPNFTFMPCAFFFSFNRFPSFPNGHFFIYNCMPPFEWHTASK